MAKIDLTEFTSREPLLSTQQAADYLGIHWQTIGFHVNKGNLPYGELMGRRALRVEDLDKLKPLLRKHGADKPRKPRKKRNQKS